MATRTRTPTKTVAASPAGRSGGHHVALIRGINVGRAKRVAMADLRALLGSLGYGEVRTLLNSGNAVFRMPASAPAKAAARIEEGMTRRLGVSARVTVLTARELDTLVADNPLVKKATDHSRLMVAVLFTRSDLKKLQPLLRRDWAPEALALGERVAYVWCPSGIIESPLFTAITRELADGVTARNWATMIKLHALVAPASGKD